MLCNTQVQYESQGGGLKADSRHYYSTMKNPIKNQNEILRQLNLALESRYSIDKTYKLCNHCKN